jgi:hypothetical protein
MGIQCTGQAGQRLGWAPCRADRAALSARLQPRAEPRGTPQPRCQGQRRRVGAVPARRASFAMSCMGICVVASVSQRSWSASSATRRLGMAPPHESHHLLTAVIVQEDRASCINASLYLKRHVQGTSWLCRFYDYVPDNLNLLEPCGTKSICAGFSIAGVSPSEVYLKTATGLQHSKSSRSDL